MASKPIPVSYTHLDVYKRQVLDAIIREVAKGGKVAITGFGTFQKVARAARTGRNPRTGDAVRIKKTTVPRFRPGTSFKGYVADPRSLPKACLLYTSRCV